MYGSPSPSSSEWGNLLKSLCITVETRVNQDGWDQPASLWVIRGSDKTHTADGGAHPWSFPVGFALEKKLELEGNPVEAVIGVRLTDRDILGAVLVSEGWGYSEAKLSALTENPALKLAAPSAYQDSHEVRLVHTILRDGSEAVAMRRRDTNQVVTAESAAAGEIGGRLSWGVRRTLGLPSQAPEPEFSHVRERAIASTALNLLESVAELDGSHSSVEQAVGWLTNGNSESVTRMLLGLSGMTGNNWEESHTIARNNYEELARTVGGEQVIRTLTLIDWCDSPMWANHIDQSTPEMSEIKERLREHSQSGLLSDDQLLSLEQVYLPGS